MGLEMGSGHVEWGAQLDILYHAEFASIHSGMFEHEKNYGHELGGIHDESFQSIT